MQNRKKRISLSSIRDRWIVGLIIFACIIIPVLDFLGLLNDIPFLSGKIVNFTLILLAILTGYVAFTQPEKQETFHENISEGISKIYDSISGTSTVALRAHPFKNVSEAMDHARKQIAYAKQQVIVIYPEIKEDFYRAVPTAAFYKQIFIATTDRIGEYQRTLPNGLPLMPRNYSFACFRMSKELLQNCVIIDDKELIVLNEVMPISTRSIQFIKVYRKYFDDLWIKAIKLKTNAKMHDDNLQYILTPPRRLPVIPPDLEACVKNCIKAHEQLKEQIKLRNS